MEIRKVLGEVTFELGLEGRSHVLGQAVGRVSGTFEEGRPVESVNGTGSRDRGVPGMVGEKGPETSIGYQSRRVE